MANYLRHAYVGIVFAMGAVFMPGASLAEPPTVVTSIKPLHSLVSGVMAGIGTPSVLISGGASPHTYSLRPSEAKRISQANIIFWIGDEIETFLQKPLKSLGRKAVIVELSKVPGVKLLKVREGGTWEAHRHEEDEHDDHGHDKHGHDKHGHDDHGHEKEKKSHKNDEMHGQYNMHMWLGRANAKAIVLAAVKALVKHDSGNASLYKKNGERTINRIENVYRKLKTDLAPVRKVPYLVFHDAYPYFERDMGLNAVGSITTHDASKPGAKRLFEIRSKIMKLGVKCIFAEPQFEPALVKTIIKGTPALTGTLDPLGSALKAGPDAYFQLLENLAHNLKGCLAKTS